MRAPQTHALAALMWVRMWLRVWVRVSAHPHPRRTVRAVPVGEDRLRLRLAAILHGVSVQRQHRRVEHRACRNVGRGMRRLPARRRALWRTRSAGVRCGAAGCSRRHRRCAGVRTRGGTRLRGAMCGGMAARSRDSIYVSEYISIHIPCDILYTIHIYVCILEPVGFISTCIGVLADGSALCSHAVVGSCCGLGSARLCSAPGAPSMAPPNLYVDSHMRAIARADDAAGDIVCARVCPPVM